MGGAASGINTTGEAVDVVYHGMVGVEDDVSLGDGIDAEREALRARVADAYEHGCGWPAER